jgi:hypothetical protein
MILLIPAIVLATSLFGSKVCKAQPLKLLTVLRLYDLRSVTLRQFPASSLMISGWRAALSIYRACTLEQPTRLCIPT